MYLCLRSFLKFITKIVEFISQNHLTEIKKKTVPIHS